MTKTIDTLVGDIYNIFLQEHTIDKKNLEELGENIKTLVHDAILDANEKRVPNLRMSVIGKPDRQLWYELNEAEQKDVVMFEDTDVFEPNPEKFLMFLFGHIIEELLVFLIKESGHTITHQQEEVEIDGVLGHTDGVIDGVVSDIKTASGYSFRNKFKNRKILQPGNEHDPFGYKGQISGYHEKLVEEYPDEIVEDEVAWLVFNKETGEIVVIKGDIMDLQPAGTRVEYLKKMLQRPIPPSEKCFPEKEVGKSGNKELHKSCTYCPFKFKCWANDANEGRGLRVFRYKDGDKYLTNVNNLPRVEEVTDEYV